MMQIKRDDAIYLEIEQFEDYELTNNIAYEMAVRMDKDFLIKDSDKEYESGTFNKNESVIKYMDKMGESKKVTFKGEVFLESELRNLTDEYSMYYDPDWRDEPLFNRVVSPHQKAYIYASINTKRPSMIDHVEETVKVVNTSFNMALDIEELIAQISIIKKEFDLYQKDIHCTAQYLGVELEKADRLICNSKGKCIDPRKVLTKQEKMADMLFIYDCMKENITKAKICRMMDDYYYDKKGKTTATDIKTVSEYQKIAIKHIDEMGYKELLTGVKNI